MDKKLGRCFTLRGTTVRKRVNHCKARQAFSTEHPNTGSHPSGKKHVSMSESPMRNYKKLGKRKPPERVVAANTRNERRT